MSEITLGDLRRLVDQLADQDDGVPVRIATTVPGVTVDLGQFPNGPRPRPVVVGGPATALRVGQTKGYVLGRGPAAFVLVEGVAR